MLSKVTLYEFATGMVSRKSESNVMVKNMLDVVIGGFGFWSIGYSFAFGDMSQDNNNSFVSTGNYFVSDDAEDSVALARYFLQLAFSTTSVTIVSGENPLLLTFHFFQNTQHSLNC